MILVTGGTGFLGSYLLQLLVNGKEPIRALFRSANKPRFQHSLIEWVEGDVLDYLSLESAMTNVSKVYHCAAVVSFETSDRAHLLKSNVEGTANVVNAALAMGVKKLAYVSSIAALGRSISQEQLIDEQTIWENGNANSGYAISKMLAEREVWRGTIEGLPAVIVNPGMILGAGDWNSGTAAFFKTIYNGLKFYTNGSNGFVGVEDVAEVLMQLMESNIENERYVLVEDNYHYQFIFEKIANSLGVKAPNVEAKPWMSALVWRILAVRKMLTGKKSVITKETASNATLNCSYSNAKIKAAISFKFTPIEEVISKTGKMFLQHLPAFQK
jgi:nucleoside-diphosphate-sugar epimerase